MAIKVAVLTLNREMACKIQRNAILPEHVTDKIISGAYPVVGWVWAGDIGWVTCPTSKVYLVRFDYLEYKFVPATKDLELRMINRPRPKQLFTEGSDDKRADSSTPVSVRHMRPDIQRPTSG